MTHAHGQGPNNRVFSPGSLLLRRPPANFCRWVWRRVELMDDGIGGLWVIKVIDAVEWSPPKACVVLSAISGPGGVRTYYLVVDGDRLLWLAADDLCLCFYLCQQ